jgi:predicted phosphodiesterase
VRSLLLPLLLAACATSASPEPARGPQVALVTETSATIAWRSRKRAVGAVEYGPTTAYGARVSTGVAQLDHAVALEGLSPDTVYHYRILQDEVVVSAGHLFRTAAPAPLLRFAVLGDSGGATAAQLAVAARVKAFAPDLVLHTGDVIYESGAPHELDPAYFTPYRDLLDRIPFYLSLGNHDVLTANGQPLLDAVVLPVNAQEGTERYYSFDRGGAHVVVLDSNSPLAAGAPQRAWLEGDLASTSANWVFVVFHHPLFSSSRHGSDLALRAELAPLFEQRGVDVVFNGHDHVYERTFPMVAGAPVESDEEPHYSDPAGPIYVVTGGGGRSLYASGTSAFTACAEAAYHHVEVELDAATATFTAVRRNGTAMDRFTIAKGP